MFYNYHRTSQLYLKRISKGFTTNSWECKYEKLDNISTQKLTINTQCPERIVLILDKQSQEPLQLNPSSMFDHYL